MNGLRALGRLSLWTQGRIPGVISRQRVVCLKKLECTTVPWRLLSSGTERSKTENERDRNYHEPSAEAKQRARMFTLATAAATAALGGMYVLYRQLSAQEKGSEVSYM